MRTEIEKIIEESWNIIAPFWPLKNLIAVNPLQGFENINFNDAIKEGAYYFCQDKIPQELEEINRQTIKYCQIYFDSGQASIAMPGKDHGFYKSIIKLMKFDNNFAANINKLHLSENPTEAISYCLSKLEIMQKDYVKFSAILLSTMSGWAGYVKYESDWKYKDNDKKLKTDFLAIRLYLTLLLWPEAKDIITIFNNNDQSEKINEYLKKIKNAESQYNLILNNNLETMLQQNINEQQRYKAQFVFCIDVRSEPFRRAIEKSGNYETFGFAGFFGIPLEVCNELYGEDYASCPVLLKPQHTIIEKHNESLNHLHKVNKIKRLYQSTKYNFTTPFSLVETLGSYLGGWMFIRNFMPSIASKIRDIVFDKKTIRHDIELEYNLSLKQKTDYIYNALKMFGLTKNFAQYVFICGHGSTTINNAYASSLDCGACGGRHGENNARVFCDMANNSEVRSHLKDYGIDIPSDTIFIASQHDTTTDDFEIFEQYIHNNSELEAITKDLKNAKLMNNKWRAQKLKCKYDVKYKSIDWSEVMPEWGLANNACFIVGPRDITKNIDLDGRSFLHSYNWQEDQDKSYLTTILTAPMIVAQWINSQYLFSALDNISWGAGSKITKNISGKNVIMQGNASDVMTGLPLQSVYKNDNEQYHNPCRLTTIIYSPKSYVEYVINTQEQIKALIDNGWINIICIDAQNNQIIEF